MADTFISPSSIPTCSTPEGIFYDFNDGARVYVKSGHWRVNLIDADSGNILFTCETSKGWVTSSKKYFVRFQIQVFDLNKGGKCVLDTTLELAGQNVLISFPVGTLGDLMGWVPYAERFREKHQCHVTCTMGKNIIELFEPGYPELTFRTPEEYVENDAKTHKPYATYRVGLFFGEDRDNHQPVDFRMAGLHRTAGYILGVDPTEMMPVLQLNAPRVIKERYVCIATMSTCQAKFWNNRTGWPEVIEYLKAQGYRVLCIDRDRVVGQGFVWNRIPHGAEDFTGNLPLSERVALLQHADFFVGLGSGLSWLAWGCQIPVVLISGFSLPACEFSTPYRVINTHVCNGCWDDVRHRFDHHDYFWCPRHKGTDRQYECTRFITAKQVIGKIEPLLTREKNNDE